MAMGTNRKFHFLMGFLYHILLTIDLALVHAYEETLRNLVYIIVFYDLLLAVIAIMRISAYRKKFKSCAMCGGILHFVTGIGCLGMRIGLYVGAATDSSSSTSSSNRPTANPGIIAFGPIFLVLGIISFIGSLGVQGATTTTTYRTPATVASNRSAVTILTPGTTPTRRPSTPPAAVVTTSTKARVLPKDPNQNEKTEEEMLKETELRLERLQKEAEIKRLERNMEKEEQRDNTADYSQVGFAYEGPPANYQYPPEGYPGYYDAYGQPIPGYGGPPPPPGYEYPAPPPQPPSAADVLGPPPDIS